MYSFALVALKLLLQTPGPNCGIWPRLNPDASVLKKFHFLVAKAAEDSRPHAAIELYHQHDVEALLVRQDHWGYRTACEYLVKRRVLYEKLDDSAG